jgi:hypothetical protein
VYDVFLTLLRTNQCKSVVLFLFSSLQSFVNKFADLFFQGPTECCANLVELVRRPFLSPVWSLHPDF